MVAAPILPQQAYDNDRRGASRDAARSRALREDHGSARRRPHRARAARQRDERRRASGFRARTRVPNRMVRTQGVSPGYFDVLGIRLIAGRMYQPGDGDVILINEEMARQYFAGQNPVGQTLVMGPEPDPGRSSAIVRDAYISGLDRVYPMVFGNYKGSAQMRVLIRPRPGIGDVAARVKAIAARLEPRAQIDAKPLAVYRDRWLMPQRMIAAVAGVVSLLALMLASIGVFGVFAFIVQERTREIGIRMAIGARASQVVPTGPRQHQLGHGRWPAARPRGRRSRLAPAGRISVRRRPIRRGDVRGRRRGAGGGGARRHLHARQARHPRRSRDSVTLRVSE